MMESTCTVDRYVSRSKYFKSCGSPICTHLGGKIERIIICAVVKLLPILNYHISRMDIHVRSLPHVQSNPINRGGHGTWRKCNGFLSPGTKQFVRMRFSD